ncbi:MAG: 30S ribosomal protein S20 [Bdellovibrionales bacterium]|nr:30S ribosomal protein S20 [Bdellovibrionales bacterium]
MRYYTNLEVVLANHKSAEKRIRSSKKRAIANRRVLQKLRNFEKLFSHQLKEKKKDVLEASLKKLFHLADKAKKRGVIKKNTASRKKSRYSQKVSVLFK